jgi:hypothetical protein
MKSVIHIAFGISCLLGLPFSVQAQFYTRVLEVHYQTIAYPETFDQYVADNQSLFDSRFFSCLDALEQYWKDQARQEEEVCNGHLDPEWRRRCREEAIFIKLPGWAYTLRLVLAGQAQWANTVLGQAAILGKTIAGPDLWVQSTNMAFQNEMIRRIFLCQ